MEGAFRVQHFQPRGDIADTNAGILPLGDIGADAQAVQRFPVYPGPVIRNCDMNKTAFLLNPNPDNPAAGCRFHPVPNGVFDQRL